MTRRQFILGATALGSTPLLAACGGDDAPPASSFVASADPASAASQTDASATSALRMRRGAHPSSAGTGSANGSSANASAPSDQPTSQTNDAASSTGFYGICAHLQPTYAPVPPWSIEQYVGTFQDLGVKMVRADVRAPDAAANLVPYFQQLLANGITPFAVLDQPVTLTLSYDANYSQGYSLGQSIASELKGLCAYFECSNEVDFSCRVDANQSGAVNPIDGKPVDGSVPSDYSAASIESFRGWVAGMLAGVKAVIPDASCGYASGVAFSNVVLDMLYNGKDLTGAVTKPPIPLDFIGVHWYESEYDILAAGPSFHTGRPVNVLQQINLVMSGKPIIVSEFGTYADQTHQASYVTSQFDVWYANRQQYNIKAALFFQLFPNPPGEGETTQDNWGLMQADGVTKKPSYAAYKNYTSTHPA